MHLSQFGRYFARCGVASEDARQTAGGTPALLLFLYQLEVYLTDDFALFCSISEPGSPI
jgi:hypothetical protein